MRDTGGDPRSVPRDLTAWRARRAAATDAGDLTRTLQDVVLPALLARARPDRALRVWFAGCGAGLVPGLSALSRAVTGRDLTGALRIYVTDRDPAALARARANCKSDPGLTGVLPSLVFGRHELTQDPALPDLDLLLCAGDLRAMDAPVRERVVARFHCALADGALLLFERRGQLGAAGPGFEALPIAPDIHRKLPVADHALQMRLLDLAVRRDGRGPVAPGAPPDPDLELANQELQCKLEEMTLAFGELERVNSELEDANRELCRVNTQLLGRKRGATPRKIK